MKITVAKTSGFCFGVNRAVAVVNDLLAKNKKVCTLGFVIHNPRVIKDFENRGTVVVDAPSKAPKDAVLVIRSHGITKAAFEYIKSKNISFIDATCPFVKKIHDIVQKNRSVSKFLLAAGDENHPEMIGIRSYFEGKSFVFDNLSKLKQIVNENPQLKSEPILMVSQTTFSIKEWEKCIIYMNKVFTNITRYDTICNITNLRQEEANLLSKKVDFMIVIGGKQSSNTQKLYDICVKNTDTILVQGVHDLENIDFSCYKNVGIIAGASTPCEYVEEICNYIRLL